MLELLALLMQQCLFFLGYITGRSEFPPALNRAEAVSYTHLTLPTKLEV